MRLESLPSEAGISPVSRFEFRDLEHRIPVLYNSVTQLYLPDKEYTKSDPYKTWRLSRFPTSIGIRSPKLQPINLLRNIADHCTLGSISGSSAEINYPTGLTEPQAASSCQCLVGADHLDFGCRRDPCTHTSHYNAS